ncbi:DUF6446 family protein [Jannaschia pohangensis]|uniref:Histidine kinase n=1 Tax=Jannaschia pohangensis TaxID=390807 RepID=A0A1I3RZM7_9RHOB|nr:DUF6446 family protein [Jannaschia pohangensis]SFJ52084.1 hypothetical protein SAMN04488095_2966 [Jannaschia pohangensis]
MGKAVVIALLLVAFGMGAGIWYAQTRGYYDPVEGPVTLTLASDTGLNLLPATDVQAIASTSSPLGFRACFAHDLTLAEVTGDLATRAHPGAAPTIAPPWFDCFDAEAIGALLASGTAQGFIAYPNVAYGVDRVVALTDDGRGWAWNELNECGRKAYDGTPVGEACPDRATYTPLTEGSL